MKCFDTDDLASFGLYNVHELMFWEKTVNEICVVKKRVETIVYFHTPSGWTYGLVLFSDKLVQKLIETLKEVGSNGLGFS